MVSIIEHHDPIEEKQIEEIETVYRIILPQDYCNFIKLYSGGKPKPRSFKYQQKENGKVLSIGVYRFMSFQSQETESYQQLLSFIMESLPAKLIPIASTRTARDWVCISCKEENYGKVYLWDANWAVEEGQEPDYSNVYFVANSFTEFLDILYEYKPNDAKPTSSY